MSKTLKKLLSIALSLCLFVGVFSFNGSAMTEVNASTDPNYTVLILDTVDGFFMFSGGSVIYEVPTSIELVKTAASAFVEQIFSEPANSNYVAIIGCGRSATLVSNFSNDKNALLNAIAGLETTLYGSNFNQALLMADSLIESVDAKNHKNIVMFMPEAPCYGDYSTEGHYTYEDCHWLNNDTGINIYTYANVIYDTISELRQKYSIFTIGLFALLEDVPAAGQSYVSFAKRCAEDFQNAGYYEANTAEDVKKEFENVANFINDEQAGQNPGLLELIAEFIVMIWDIIKVFFGM